MHRRGASEGTEAQEKLGTPSCVQAPSTGSEGLANAAGKTLDLHVADLSLVLGTV